jgi:predicted double-glycine peptidase
MAKTPISEHVETIELVRTMKRTLDSLADVVEDLGNRVVRLEQKTEDDAEQTGG